MFIMILRYQNQTYLSIHPNDPRFPTRIVFAFALTPDETTLGRIPCAQPGHRRATKRCPMQVVREAEPSPHHSVIAAELATHGRYHVMFHDLLDAIIFRVGLR